MRPTERLVLGALLALLLWNCLYYTPYVVDDAFISMRYARNLVEGEGLVYNPGERVEGYSNFLWVLASAAVQACGLPVLTGIKALGVVAGLATGLLTFLLGRTLFRDRPGGSLAALLAAGLVCTNTNLAVWSQGGLETPLFTALIVGMCLRYEIELGKRGSWPVSAGLFALLWLTRPEAPAYGLYFLVRRWGRAERLGRSDGVWLAALAAVVVPYEAWGLAYYGALFPNTHAAKIGESLPGLERGLAQFQLFAFVGRQGWAFPALCSLGLLGCLKRWRGVPAAAWAPLVSGTIFLLYAWRDWMPRFRFMVPMLPALFLLVAHGVLELGKLPRSRPASRREALDDLFRRQPVLMVIPLRAAIEDFDRAIRDDPRAERYERTVSRSGVQYLRKDRPSNPPGRRLRAAVQRYPEYASGDTGGTGGQRE